MSCGRVKGTNKQFLQNLRQSLEIGMLRRDLQKFTVFTPREAMVLHKKVSVGAIGKPGFPLDAFKRMDIKDQLIKNHCDTKIIVKMIQWTFGCLILRGKLREVWSQHSCFIFEGEVVQVEDKRHDVKTRRRFFQGYQDIGRFDIEVVQLQVERYALFSL